MRFFKSLLARLISFVILVVIVTQALTLYLSYREQNQIISDQIVNEIIDTLATLEGNLEDISPNLRPQFLSRYNRPGSPQLLDLNQATPNDLNTYLNPIDYLVAEKLTVILQDNIIVRSSNSIEKPVLWIKVQILEHPYWLLIPMGRYQYQPDQAIWLAGLLALTLALSLAIPLAWKTTRPLKQLSEASQKIELGQQNVQVIQSGPLEVQQLAQSFNHMSKALALNASQRRLMLGGLSHDLRTPLTRLKLLVDMQEQDADHLEMQEDIDELSRIISQFIDFIRSEEPKSHREIDLSVLAQQVCQRFSRNTDIECRYDTNLPFLIQGDSLSWERILNNLIENSVRYGKQPIVLELLRASKYIEITILDQGEGIDPKDYQTALLPFERLSKHRGVDGGSGLGLAIVERLVIHHQGELRFNHPKSGGFSISIKIPTFD